MATRASSSLTPTILTMSSVIPSKLSTRIGGKRTVADSWATCGACVFLTSQSAPRYSQTSRWWALIRCTVGATNSTGIARCSITDMSGRTNSPPLNAAMGSASSSGSTSIAMPLGGRPLVIANLIPAPLSRRTEAMVRSVSSFAGVTRVPSTSAKTSSTADADLEDSLTVALLRLAHPTSIRGTGREELTIDREDAAVEVWGLARLPDPRLSSSWLNHDGSLAHNQRGEHARQYRLSGCRGGCERPCLRRRAGGRGGR